MLNFVLEVVSPPHSRVAVAFVVRGGRSIVLGSTILWACPVNLAARRRLGSNSRPHRGAVATRRKASAWSRTAAVAACSHHGCLMRSVSLIRSAKRASKLAKRCGIGALQRT